MQPREERRPTRIPLLIACAEGALRERLKALLADAFPIEIIGEATDARQCREQVRELRPRVVLIVEAPRAMPALELCRELQRTSPGIIPMVLADTQEATFLAEAMSAGARGFALTTASRDVLIDRITRAAEVGPPGVEGPPRAGQLIVIHSAKGGVGKSLLAASLSLLLAQRLPTAEVLLVDLDLQFGDLPLLLDVQPSRSIIDLLPLAGELRPDNIANVLTRYDQRLRLLAAPAVPGEAFDITADHARRIFRALKLYFDLVIVDTSSYLSEAVLEVFPLADRIIEVCLPDMLSLRELRKALDLLAALQVPKDNIALVINRVSRRCEIQTAEIRRLFDHPLLGEIPSDYLALQGYVNRGTLATLLESKLPLVRSLQQIAAKMVTVPTPVEAVSGQGRRRRS